MKEFLIINIEMIIMIVTVFVTLINGILCKKCSFFNNKYIPITNIMIMLISTLIYWYATGSLSMTIASGSPIATLIYDTYHKIKGS